MPNDGDFVDINLPYIYTVKHRPVCCEWTSKKCVSIFYTDVSCCVPKKKNTAKLCTYQNVNGAHYKACNQWGYTANNNGWENPPRVLGTNLRRIQVQKDWNCSFDGVLFLLSLHHQNNHLQKYLYFYLPPSNSVAKKKKLYLG